MKRTPRAGQSNLPVPKSSKGSPNNAKSTLSKGGPTARSAEDIPRRVQLSVAGGAPTTPQRRAISPGTPQRKSLLPSPVTVQNGGQSGVRYITEDLIRKMCKEDSLEMVTTLNLTLTRAEAGKKIKYIENLDRMKRLQVLILSNNVIEKIEKLDKLLKLKELDLSNNCIVKIEGLENLTNLQILNLSGNLIEHIPIWMGKRLKSLRAFHVGKNRLESLSELAKLKPLPDLTQLTVAENPLAEFNHCRPYLVFHLRTVEVIDGQAVTERERVAAMDRFEQDEVERLEKQLENEEAKCRRLEEDHNRSKQERSHLSATEDDLRKREKLQNSRIEELERELETKNDLLKKKTSELNKACEKHYQLEQELAFHKIDSKFDSLGRGPEQSYDDIWSHGLKGIMDNDGRKRRSVRNLKRSGGGAVGNIDVYGSVWKESQELAVIKKRQLRLLSPDSQKSKPYSIKKTEKLQAITVDKTGEKTKSNKTSQLTSSVRIKLNPTKKSSKAAQENVANRGKDISSVSQDANLQGANDGVYTVEELDRIKTNIFNESTIIDVGESDFAFTNMTDVNENKEESERNNVDEKSLFSKDLDINSISKNLNKHSANENDERKKRQKRRALDVSSHIDRENTGETEKLDTDCNKKPRVDTKQDGKEEINNSERCRSEKLTLESGSGGGAVGNIDVYGSVWKESPEPVIKKRRRRSSLFVGLAQRLLSPEKEEATVAEDGFYEMRNSDSDEIEVMRSDKKVNHCKFIRVNQEQELTVETLELPKDRRRRRREELFIPSC